MWFEFVTQPRGFVTPDGERAFPSKGCLLHKKQPLKLFLTCRFAEKQTCTAQHDISLKCLRETSTKKKSEVNNISCVSFADDNVSNMSSMPMRQQLGMVKDEPDP
jgi:hypothetical protein